MFGLRYAFSIFCLLVLSASAAFSQGANYPDKPVTIISDSPAGSSPDVVARFVAEGLGKLWGQQVVVLNKPGANGSIAAHAASEAAADGYTIGIGQWTSHVGGGAMYNLPFDLHAGKLEH